MFRPPPADKVSIRGPAGLLEALVEAPESPASFAVVCHPHPLFGGTLHNKVVHTLARAFQESGAATVRFNFRGVGASAGSFGEGIGESDDALAVIEWGRTRWPQARLWLAGFSFGAAVAIRIAAPADPARLVTVAPAVDRVDVTAAAVPACPWLIVQGEADEVVSSSAVQAWARRFAPAAELVLLPGVGHYFHGRLPELRDAVLGFIGSQKKSPGS